MILSHQDTVSALTYSLIREECDEAAANARFLHNRVARFVLEQQRRMPDFLRFPMILLTLLFDAQSFIVSGRPFHRLPHDRRRRQIASWRASRLSFCSDLVRFYQGLVVYGWYSMLDEHETGGQPH